MKKPQLSWGVSALLFALLLALPAFADDAPAAAAAAAAAAPAGPPKLDSGDTSWMLASTALVLLMTIPGLALFYGGMVRKKNILATLMQSFVITCIVTIVWCVAGYSIAFTTGNAYMGDFSRFMLNGIWDHIANGNDTQAFSIASGIKDVSDLNTTIPETVYMMFQMTFAIITPALIAGSFADRMKFSALCIFITLWSLLIYAPIAHWVWAPSGWAALNGQLDFAGGTVVHINAGIAGLMCALVLGKRVGYGTDNMAPYNLAYSVIGASLLWVGWFGFNAGSAVAANGRAGMAMAVTQIATAAAALGWMFAEWIAKGKPSVLGVISGAVAGLVAITPASGFVLPGASIIIGVAAGVICFFAATSVKHLFGYDDSLDAFGVHCIGGIVGALLTGVFAFAPLSAIDADHTGTSGSLAQLWIQCQGVAATLVYSGGGTLVLLFITKALVGLRVSEDEEREGLDIILHGEQVF
jgi:Amt family ammonium transporter